MQYCNLADYDRFLNLSGFDRPTIAFGNKMNTYFGQGFIRHNPYDITNQSYGCCQIKLGAMLASKPFPYIERSTE